MTTDQVSLTGPQSVPQNAPQSIPVSDTPTVVDTPTDTADEPKKRGRKPRTEKQIDDYRMKQVPVWLDDNVQTLSKGFDEKDKWIYVAAVTKFSELNSEDQLKAITAAKIMNKEVVESVKNAK